jgi:hypothetical protein
MTWKKGSLFLSCLALCLAIAACGGSKGQVGANMVLSVQPSTISFAAVSEGGEDSRSVLLKHVGDSGTIHLKTIAFTDATSKEFTFDPPDRMDLAPGEETVLLIWYRPTDQSADTGELVITHNIPNTNFQSSVYLDAAAQLAELYADPNPINFSKDETGNETGVKGGTFKDLDVTLTNKGKGKVTLNEIFLSPDPKWSKDFAILHVNLPDAQTLPYLLNPEDKIGLVMRYEPKDGGDDEQRLMVNGIAGDGSDLKAEFTVKGKELGPKCVLPVSLDFGEVALGESKTLEWMVSNEGNDTLTIKGGGIHFLPGSDANLSVDDGPAQDLAIAKDGEFKMFHITWKALENKTFTGDPIGFLQVETTQPTNPEPIKVFGRVYAPLLTLVPDAIDFGFVGQMITAESTITLRNDGSAPLKVKDSDITIVDDAGGEFAIKSIQKFCDTGTEPYLTDGKCPDDAIQGGYTWMLTLNFTNKGPASGHVTARLRVLSNSPDANEKFANLAADRAGSPVCKIALAPPSINYGVVPHGYFKELSTMIANIGTGYCSFLDARVSDCSNFGGMMETCPEPFSGAPSTTFKFTALPPKVKNGIAPGAKVPLTIRFTPPKTSSIWTGILDSYSALLAVKVYDDQLKKEVETPVCTSSPTGGTCKANIKGGSGIAKVAVMPAEVKFGLVTIGCHSKTYKVCVYNTGNAPLTVSAIDKTACSPEFKLKNVPGLPKEVSAGVPMCFETVYAPQNLGDDACTIQIQSSDSTSPLLSVGLTGSGTYETEQTDLFTQVSGQEVDVLFVIDDSGSMCEEQDRLVANYNAFISQSKVWGNDYHIGVMSLNVVDENVMGKLNRGDAKLSPRYITKNDSPNTFVKLADMGCDGGSDAQESGLAAAQQALAAPLTTDTGIACKTDTDCQNDKNLCTDPKKCPFYCIDGACGGWNKGFLRDEAQLEIIVLSDEQDQSPSAPSFYIDFFKNIKGFYNTSMFHFNAICGPQGGCTAPDGGTAEAGMEYIKTAQETNGLFGSICDSDYGPIMSQIGAKAFGLKVQFFLSRLADAATVKVWVDDKACTAGWSYDAPSNSVIFQENGTCMPQPGQVVKIHYKTLCLTN